MKVLYNGNEAFLLLFFFFLAALGLRCCAPRGFSLVAVSGDYSSMQCAGCSLQWLLWLQNGSRHTGFSSCGLRAELLHCMWDLPGPGFKPVSPALAGAFLSTGLPGESLGSPETKILMNEIEDTNNQWSWVRGMNTVEMSTQPKVIYRFTAICVKIPIAFFTDTEKTILKYIWKHRRPQITNSIMKQKNKDFPDGTDKNPPTRARSWGLIPGAGRFHTSRSDWAC